RMCGAQFWKVLGWVRRSSGRFLVA
ncbi:hypothetical protein A2U01_0114074, partial [Trifolium medium]|nr:hypothetical protein [Trifolium medium]